MQFPIKKRSNQLQNALEFSRMVAGMPVYAFGPFILDARERRLTRDGAPIVIAGKTLGSLELLVEAGGRLVDRETFQARLWPETTVEERNLTVHISTLRKALS